jgi:NAD(P)-dependent dehydrogenase (short-subunit alcohol dehydrogenase family)
MAGALSGKTVIVTGSTRGIGKVIATYLAREGAEIVVTGRSQDKGTDNLPGTIADTVNEIESAGGRALGVKCDLALDEDLSNLIDATLGRFGKIDVLVNNAVIVGKRQPFLSSDASWLDTSFRVNTRAPYVLMQKAGAHMVGRGGGSIINITTGGLGQPPAPTGPVSEKEMDSIDPCYPISKAPLDRMTTALASELWASNIGITAITPGLVITERIRAAALRPWVDMNAGQPAEITAAACAFLIQNPFKYTGRKIPARDILEEEGLLEDLLASVQTA